MYTYRVQAENFNGLGLMSDDFTFNACLVPSGMSAPIRLDASAAGALVVQWDDPLLDGGCPVSGFAVFRDNGNWGDVSTELNSVSDSSVRDNPVLRQLTITNLPLNSENMWFRIKVRVFNREGYSDSTLLRILNAGVPASPASAPTLVS